LTAKYHHTCERYRQHIETELSEVGRVNTEIIELEHSIEKEKQEALQAAMYFKADDQVQFDELISRTEPLKDICLTFAAFFSLVAPGAWDGKFHWKYVVEMLKDRKLMYQSMHDEFDRIVR